MSGIFNIAVAEFGETSPDGAVHASAAGKQMSEWTANYLQDDPNKGRSQPVGLARRKQHL